jgi:FKBP-type peptidyl-prolyl cis-trans isomerase 2
VPCSVGGLAAGLVVELSNGANAVVIEMDDANVKLDANSMLAGKKMLIDLELVGISDAA